MVVEPLSDEQKQDLADTVEEHVLKGSVIGFDVERADGAYDWKIRVREESGPRMRNVLVEAIYHEDKDDWELNVVDKSGWLS